MADKIPQPRPPGTAIVPRNAGGAASDIPSQLLAATDLAVGTLAHTSRFARRVGGIGWGASIAVGRLVRGLPGADDAGRRLNTLTRPLLDDGRDVRIRTGSAAQAATQRLLEALVPRIVDALDLDTVARQIDVDAVVTRIDIDALVRHIDIDRLVQRIDIDRLVRHIDIDSLVRRIEIDALVQRIDIDRLVRRIEIDVLVQRIDIDRLVRRIDVGDIAARIDVNEVVQRVDVDAIVEETELGTIVARSTSGFASQALDAARSQTAVADTRVSRVVNRVLRRNDVEMPAGPPLLTGEPIAAGSARASDTEEPSSETPSTDSER